MKKPLLHIIAIAFISSFVVSFNSCTKLKTGVVEIQNAYNSEIKYFAAISEDAEDLGTVGSGVPYHPKNRPTTITCIYWEDKNLQDLGYTKSTGNFEGGLENAYENEEGSDKPGKGGYWANTTSTSGTGTGTSKVVFYAGSNTQYSQPIYITLNGTVILFSPGNRKMLYADWGTAYPTCSTAENCSQDVLCDIIKVDVTQANNTWVANETNSARTWSGSFTKAEGCTLIEVK